MSVMPPDETGTPWKVAETGDVIVGHQFRLRRGVGALPVGPRWLLDMRPVHGEWSTQTPLGSNAQEAWEPSAIELEAELADHMPAESAGRLLRVFRADYPDELPDQGD
jgi:hypothetical protein